MEVILDILSLHIYIKGEAIKSYVRIKRHNQWAPKDGETLWRKSHTQMISKIQQSLPGLHQPNKQNEPKNIQVSNFHNKHPKQRGHSQIQNKTLQRRENTLLHRWVQDRPRMWSRVSNYGFRSKDLSKHSSWI